MRRTTFAVAAWFAGWRVDMVAMVLTVYDGVLSLILQPIMAALFSTVFTAVALFRGLVLRTPALGRIWSFHQVGPILMIGISLFILCFGAFQGWTEGFVNSETGSAVTSLKPHLIFAIANWPLQTKAKA